MDQREYVAFVRQNKRFDVCRSLLGRGYFITVTGVPVLPIMNICCPEKNRLLFRKA
jgi:hypothetical protein